MSNHLVSLHINNGTNILVVWFSAFTRGPKLGQVLKSKNDFHGYRIAKQHKDLDWLLVKDTYGLTNDGSYYSGKPNDYFIEDEFSSLFCKVKDNYSSIIFIGSSMGAYAAMKFSLLHGVNHIALFAPHFDLKVARDLCGRKKWIEYLYEEDSYSNFEINEFLSRLQFLIKESNITLSKKQIYLQCSVDDFGVYSEQVLPFISQVKNFNSNLYVDEREFGGHTGLFMSDELILYVIRTLLVSGNFDSDCLRNLPVRKISHLDRIENILQKFENYLYRFLDALGVLSLRK